MFIIESRLHSDNRYINHGGRKTHAAHAPHSILVRGASGKSSARSSLSAEDYAWLKDEPTFKAHVKNGSLIVHLSTPVTPIVEEQAVSPGDETQDEDDDKADMAPSTKVTDEIATGKDARKEPTKTGNGKKAK